MALLAGVLQLSTPAGAGNGFTVFGDQVPRGGADSDSASVELGMRFRVTTPGDVVSVRFYKHATNTGVHTGSLWTAGGIRLATVTFRNETASGWQEAAFSTPVRLLAGRAYVVSYFAPNGHYASVPGLFDTGRTSGPIVVPSGNLVRANGSFRYGATSGFPTQNFDNSGYYVDLRFRPLTGGTGTSLVTSTTSGTTQTTATTTTPTTARPTTTTAPPTTAPPTTAPPTTAPPTTAPPTTAPPTTAPPTTTPSGGFVVGSGASAMTFPERPGLTTAESALTAYTGPRTFSSGTYVFENCLVTGATRLHFPTTSTANVTFRNCRFAISDDWMILGQGGRITIEHCEFDGVNARAENFPIAIEGGGSIRFSEFLNNTDNIRLSSGTLAEWNYIHSSKTRTSTGNAHSDGFEIYYGRRPNGVTGPHIIVRNNFVDLRGAEGATGAVNITTDFGPVDGVRVEGNTFMPGGSYSLYVRLQTTSGPLRNVEIVNNEWFSDSGNRWGGYYGTHSVDPGSAITQWSGNLLTPLAGGASKTVTLGNSQP